MAPPRSGLVSVVSVALLASACGAAIPPRPRAERLPDADALVQAYYSRVNAEDLRGVLALMVPEPVLVEPFTQPERATEHRGYEAVARFFANAFRARDDQVVPEFVRGGVSSATAGWSLHGADGAAASGETRFELRGGQIAVIRIERRD